MKIPSDTTNQELADFLKAKAGEFNINGLSFSIWPRDNNPEFPLGIAATVNHTIEVGDTFVECVNRITTGKARRIAALKEELAKAEAL